MRIISVSLQAVFFSASDTKYTVRPSGLARPLSSASLSTVYTRPSPGFQGPLTAVHRSNPTQGIGQAGRRRDYPLIVPPNPTPIQARWAHPLSRCVKSLSLRPYFFPAVGGANLTTQARTWSMYQYQTHHARWLTQWWYGPAPSRLIGESRPGQVCFAIRHWSSSPGLMPSSAIDVGGFLLRHAVVCYYLPRLPAVLPSTYVGGGLGLS